MKSWWPVALVAAAAVLGVRAWLQPLDHGIDTGAFAAGPRDTQPAAGLVEARSWPAGERPPNIVVILADDLGWGDIGVQGARAIATPHIDQLAADGVRLTDFYASAPVCTPSRAGLLTGRYPLRSGFASVLGAVDEAPAAALARRLGIGLGKLGMTDMAGAASQVDGIPLSEITLAEALRTQGYRTLAVGKWHLGDFTRLPEYHPQRHGFEHFFGYNMANDDFPVALWRDAAEITPDIGIRQSTHTREFTEEAVKYIRQWKDEPYFVYLAHKDPHLPFFPSERFAGTSRAGPYGDAVSELDWSVGELRRALRETGQERNTLVILTSDNGPWYEGSTGGLRGRKGESFEGGFRVPFVAAWPGTLPAGEVRREPAMNIDIFATALAAAGVSLPKDRLIDGDDLLPLLAGDPRAIGRAGERALYFFHEYDIEAVRVGPWKLIAANSHYTWPIPLDKKSTLIGRLAGAKDYHPAGGGPPVPVLGTWPMLHDMRLDPAESYNVASRHPERVRSMSAMLNGFHESILAAPRGWK